MTTIISNIIVTVVKGKLITFVEVPVFVKRIDDLGSIDLLTAIQDDLIKNPERGAIIAGAKGARKARIADPSRQKGKRGGFRYIYVYFEVHDRIYLLYIYGKNEQEDLTREQARMLGEIVKEAKEELRRGGR